MLVVSVVKAAVIMVTDFDDSLRPLQIGNLKPKNQAIPLEMLGSIS